MAGRHPELSPWLAQYHPLGDEHGQAGTVLGPVQGKEHGAQPAQQAAPGTKTSQNHNTALQTPGNTQATVAAEYTHSTLLESFNLPITATRRRQGQQLYAWHGTPSRRSQAAPPFPQTPAGEATQPQPPALPPEARPCECKTNKAKQPKRDKVLLNTNHS